MTSRRQRPSLAQRLRQRLRHWRSGLPTVDYDALGGVEHLGHVVLLTRRDGSPSPVSFEHKEDAAAWYETVKGRLNARNIDLLAPPELANLAKALPRLSRRPEATNDHVLGVLIAALHHASVSVATLDTVSGGLMIRCRRFGRLHLGGTLPSATGRALISTLSAKLDGETSGTIALDSVFPGPTMEAHVSLTEEGVKLRPAPPQGVFSDLLSWGVTPSASAVVRDLIVEGKGLLLIIGRRDSGKSTLAGICEAEAAMLAPGNVTHNLDELNDADAIEDAIERATQGLVIATLRSENAREGFAWLRAQGLSNARLQQAVEGVLETALVPVTCTTCAGEGCERCQRCGVIGRHGQLEVARLETALHEQETLLLYERERRKLTA